MDRVERETYRLHVRASMAEGVFSTLFLMGAPDVAAKNMAAGPLEVTLINMAPGVTLFLSLFIAGHMNAARPRRLLLSAAFLGRLPILFLLWRGDVWTFLVLLMVQSFAQMPITATWNTTLRRNYRDETRGTLYGRATAYAALCGAAAALGAGVWLDRSPDAYRWIYPAAGVLGVISCWIFSRISLRPGGPALVSPPNLGALSAVRDVLGKDRRFRRFEIGFFLYGLAFMMVLTARPLYAAHDLGLSNKAMLGAYGIYSIMAVLVTPAMGRWMDRVGPASLAARCYVLLCAYALVLLVTRNAATYCIAQGLFGVAMAGVGIVWNMGPVTLAPAGDVARYMALHVALVGVRAVIGHPASGILVATTGDPRWVFLAGALLFGSGALVMSSVVRRWGPAPVPHIAPPAPHPQVVVAQPVSALPDDAAAEVGAPRDEE